MAVLLKNGAVFLHIPKTGGTWITEVLYKLGLVEQEFSHQHANMVRVLHADKFPPGKSSEGQPNKRLSQQIEISTFKFCFVRDPFKWYESWWKYMNTKGWNSWGRCDDKNHWHPCLSINGTGSHDFDTFVENVIKIYPGFVTNLYNQYTENGIHFIGKQESLASDLVHVLKTMKLDIDPELIYQNPVKNASKNPQFQLPGTSKY